MAVIFSRNLLAQSASHPPFMKWKKITTEHFEILYSADIESEAQRVANLSEHYLQYNLKTMKPSWRKTTIVLASEAAESNGGVNYAPYMAEYYNTPSTFAANEWYTTLSVHENRHMVQLNTINMGSRKIFWYAFGDYGSAVYTVLFVPSWTLEGDAVLSETSLTSGGRGRLPSFDLWQRTNELSTDPQNRYSYYRAYLGSPMDNYPYANFYVLGYHMVTYGRRTYGAMFWNDTVSDMGNGGPLAFAHMDDSIIRSTRDRNGILGLYQSTYDDLRAKWQQQVSGLTLTQSSTIVPAGDPLWSGCLSIHESNGKLYALQTGKSSLTGIVEITSAQKKRFIHNISIGHTLSYVSANERPLSIGGGKAVWVEDVADIRWGLRSYTSIMVCNLKTGASKRLFPQGKFTSAAISKDGSQIAAVEFDEKRRCSLVIIDAAGGSITSRFPAMGNDFYYDPAWSDNGQSVVTGVLAAGGSGLNLFDISTGRVTPLITLTTEEHPKTPYIAGKRVFYSSDYSGIDNIYVLDLATKRRYQVTSRKFGAYYPSVSESGENLYFSDYTVKGYSGEQMAINPGEWVPIQKVKVDRIDYFEPVVAQEAGRSVSAEVPSKEYKSENYSPLLNSIRFHSWMPQLLYYYGLAAYSDDPLHTTSIVAAYNYFPNENANSVLGYISYFGLFPVLTAGGTYGERVKPDADNNTIRWDERSAYGTITLPLNFSRGSRTLSLSGSVTGSYTEISNKSKIENSSTLIDNGNLTSLAWNALFVHAVEGTYLDIYPRWAQTVSLDYAHTPSGDYIGKQLAVAGALYFPSVFTHHSFYVNGGFESDSSYRYRFPMKFLYPWGYEEEYAEKYYKFTANYALPLAYPDIAIWKLLYIKRLNSELFYDFGRGTTSERDFLRRSAGVELTLQYNLLSNTNLLFATGFRFGYLFETDEYAFQVVYKLGGVFQ